MGFPPKPGSTGEGCLLRPYFGPYVYLTLPAPGFSGAMCQLDGDECASTPCRNGAKCVDQPDGYECRCAEGEDRPMTRRQESGGGASGGKGPIIRLGESWGQSCRKAGLEQDQ